MRPLPKPPVWLVPLVAVVVLVGHNLRIQPWTLDDAFITLRYAENLAAGHGPVFNPGEVVEGYTCFLWMVLLAAAAKLGASTLMAAKALGAAAHLGTVALVAGSHRLVPGVSAAVARWAGLTVATAGILSHWSMSGMEVPLVSMLAVAALVLHLRERGGAGGEGLPVVIGVVAALAMMTRPDAGLVFGALWLDRVARVLMGGGAGRRTEAHRLLVNSAVFVAVYGAYFAWRLDYYGWPLPNTFYVKVGATADQVLRGADYARLGLTPGWALAGLAAASLLPVFRPRGGLVVGTLFAGMHTAYVIAVGGDVFWGYRFFAVLIPVLALVGAGTAARLPSGAWSRLPVALAGLPILVNLFWVLSSHQLNTPKDVSAQGEVVGRWLGGQAPPDAVVATNIAGTVPYYSGLVAIDTLGLNDLHIAHRVIEDMGEGRPGHEKGDGAYVLSRAPDYVIFASSLGDKRPKFLGDRELYESPEFKERYALHVYALPEDLKLFIWVLRPEHGGRGLAAAPVAVIDFEKPRTLRLAE